MRKVTHIAASTTIRSGHLGVRRRCAKGAAVILLASLVVMAPTTATAKDSAANRSGDPSCHLRLERDRRRATLSADTTKQPVEDILYTGFVQAAVYNAVVGIDGRYEPYRFHARAPASSSQAAAVAAAHKVLVTYSPYAQSTLDAAYATSLAQDPRRQGQDPRRRIRHPRRRQPDRHAHQRRTQRARVVHPPPAPGRLAAHAPGVPADGRAMDGRRHAAAGAQRRSVRRTWPTAGADLCPVHPRLRRGQGLGSANSTARTAEQTSTALFFSGNAVVQFNAALRDQVTCGTWTSSTPPGCSPRST